MSKDYGALELCFQESTPSPPRTLKSAVSAIATDIMRELYLFYQIVNCVLLISILFFDFLFY
jgi:hypothetical protein